MNKIKEFFINYSFYIFMVVFTIFIIVMINSVNSETFDYMLLTIGALMILICIIISISSVKHNKKRVKELYDKYGKESVDLIFKYESINLEKEYGKRIAYNDDVDRVFEYVCYNCDDLLENESSISYLDSDYKRDIKNIKGIKGTDDFIKISDKVMKIINKYYDKDGKIINK